jgi:glycosyltransferase involved in cell wall biosynthesis
MKIMFVTNSLSGGGAERATNILINALSDTGTDVALVAVNDGPMDLVEPACEVFELKREWQGGPVSVIKAYFGLQAAIRKWKPDFLVLNCDIPELLGSIAIGKHQLIAVEHASQPWPQRQPLGRFVRKLLCFRKTRWVAVSDHLKVWGLNALPNIVINNAINPLDHLPKTQVRDDFNLIRRLIFVGRLSPEKNPSLLVSVSKEVKLPLLFIGSGNQSEEIKELCEHSGVTFEMKGFVKDPWSEFQSGDLLVIPSKNEGDGLVLVEAVQRGIPLVVNAIPDLARFGLQNLNYFKDSSNLIKTIIASKENLNQFIVSAEIADSLLSDRKPEKVGRKWLNFLIKEISGER